jgi:hypothetical protein
MNLTGLQPKLGAHVGLVAGRHCAQRPDRRAIRNADGGCAFAATIMLAVSGYSGNLST